MYLQEMLSEVPTEKTSANQTKHLVSNWDHNISRSSFELVMFCMVVLMCTLKCSIEISQIAPSE